MAIKPLFDVQACLETIAAREKMSADDVRKALTVDGVLCLRSLCHHARIDRSSLIEPPEPSKLGIVPAAPTTKRGPGRPKKVVETTTVPTTTVPTTTVETTAAPRLDREQIIEILDSAGLPETIDVVVDGVSFTLDRNPCRNKQGKVSAQYACDKGHQVLGSDGMTNARVEIKVWSGYLS